MVNKMNIYIVDDEAIALDVLEIKIKKIVKFTPVTIKKFINPIEVLNEIKKGAAVDAVFLDIEMPGLNGIDLAEEIKEVNAEIDIVFLTAYNEYAVKAFELYALDYLLKPVKSERLQKTLDRVIAKKVMRNNVEPAEIYVKFMRRFEIIYKKTTSLNWKTYKVKELCAYFFNQQGVFLDKEKIIDDIWPDVNYEKAKVNFYTCISYLRKMFREIGMPEMLQKNGNGYIMKLTFSSDLEELYTLLIKLKKNLNCTEEDCYKLVSLYPGEYMEENDYLWMRDRQNQIRAEYLAILENLAEKQADDNKELAIFLLNKAIELNPFREKYYQCLLQLYTLLKRKTEGLNIFKQLETILQEEFHIPPSVETLELVKVLRSL
ncbi:response regulator [Niallia sp. NCCP-28]|uniref:response regulator n=1 Tax=Niallia sp. NCCP-28 TaxID=2934712 RepID=UPI002086ACC5|nr:response regulator [Niallia sp. NCCP-28]GKU82240.1 DNA-binding response regulator [Niallia sp. NCCP-28]